VGYSDTGWKVVEEQDNEIVAPLQNISRKVMLSVEDTGRLTYLVIAVNAATVFGPYYPVKSDLILIQGDDVHFFVKHAGDNIWAPENTQAQDIH